VGYSDMHRELHRLFNERKWAEMREHFAADLAYEDLPRQLTTKSADEFVDYLQQGWATSFSDAAIGSPEYSEGRDLSVAVFHGRGTNDGPLGELPPTGRSMDLVLTEILRWGTDGKVTGGQLNYDQLTMLTQLGHAAGPTDQAAMAPATGPAETVTTMFEVFDRMDADAMRAQMASDPQGVDEITRSWLRGREGLEQYLGQLAGSVSDVRSSLTDLAEREYGDTALVTCWLEQDYTTEGKAVHVSAPCTVVLRREDGSWKAALIHAVPLETTVG